MQGPSDAQIYSRFFLIRPVPSLRLYPRSATPIELSQTLSQTNDPGKQDLAQLVKW